MLSLGTAGLKEKTGQELFNFLSDPQALNSYAYARNNPLRHVDPDGEWIKEVITGKQSWNDFVIEIGDAGNYLYENSKLAQTIMDHPIAAGAVTGVASGAAAVGGAAAISAFSEAYLGGAGTACLVWCGQAIQQGRKVVDYTAKYGPSLGSHMNQVHQIYQKAGLNFDPHLVERTVQRFNRGVTPEKVLDAINTGTKYYDKWHKNYSYFKDGVRVAQELSGQFKTVVTQNSINTERFIEITK